MVLDLVLFQHFSLEIFLKYSLLPIRVKAVVTKPTHNVYTLHAKVNTQWVNWLGHERQGFLIISRFFHLLTLKEREVKLAAGDSIMLSRMDKLTLLFHISKASLNFTPLSASYKSPGGARRRWRAQKVGAALLSFGCCWDFFLPPRALGRFYWNLLAEYGICSKVQRLNAPAWNWIHEEILNLLTVIDVWNGIRRRLRLSYLQSDDWFF